MPAGTWSSNRWCSEITPAPRPRDAAQTRLLRGARASRSANRGRVLQKTRYRRRVRTRNRQEETNNTSSLKGAYYNP